MQIALESDLDAGHLTFSGLGLKHLTAGDVIRRSTYSVGGQATAVKVQGDPEAGKNGIFFLYTDHLGSTSVMSYGYNPDGSLHPQAGQKVDGSDGRYLPFGGWRGTTPTAGLTDRGYTGHKSNNLGSNDLGLIYMNARFYAPGVSRFVTADTIVPDPADPQSHNRYAYARNNPLRFKDPSGHCIVGYSGDVRMDQYPYGTSGVCPNTEHWIIEGNAAIAGIHSEGATHPEPDGTSLYVSVDPVQTPALNGTGGLEVLYNHDSEEITLFAVAGGALTLGGSVSGRIMVNNVFNIGDDNLNYSGLFVFLNGMISNGIGLTGGLAYTPQQDNANFIAYWKRDPDSAYSNGIGGAVGVGAAFSGGPVEYIPLFTVTPDGQLIPHAGWYLFENDQQWWLSAQFAEIVQLLAQYADFDPENYNWNGGE